MHGWADPLGYVFGGRLVFPEAQKLRLERTGFLVVRHGLAAAIPAASEALPHHLWPYGLELCSRSRRESNGKRFMWKTTKPQGPTLRAGTVRNLNAAPTLASPDAEPPAYTEAHWHPVLCQAKARRLQACAVVQRCLDPRREILAGPRGCIVGQVQANTMQLLTAFWWATPGTSMNRTLFLSQRRRRCAKTSR